MSSLVVFEAAIWVQSTHLINHVCKPEKKLQKFLHKYPSK